MWSVCDLATGEDTDCGDRAGDADGGHVADGLEVNRLSFCRDREAGDNCQSNYRSGDKCFHFLSPSLVFKSLQK